MLLLVAAMVLHGLPWWESGSALYGVAGGAVL